MSLSLPTPPEFLQQSKQPKKKKASNALRTRNADQEKIQSALKKSVIPVEVNEIKLVETNIVATENETLPILKVTTPVVPEEKKIIPLKALKLELVDQELNWKNLLKKQENSYGLLLQREWGLLSDRINSLAPETRWTFLWFGNETVSKTLIAQVRGWMERFINSSAWEGPKEAKVIFGQEGKATVFSMTWDKGDLPPPLLEMLPGWRILPTTEKNEYGFKMIYSESFISTKAGRA